MGKNNIKKLLITIFLIIFLVMFFLFVKNINDEKENKKITIVKNIVREKYDYISYNNNSKYLYGLIKEDNYYLYEIYDFYGNKLYSIKNDKEMNIVNVMKKYYITYDDKYHLYDIDGKEIISSDVIESLNDYLIKVNNKIIDINNKVLFEDVHSINSYNHNNYFNINNYYLINKKGEIILENTIIKEEIKNNLMTDYFIVQKDGKNYTFFVRLDRIIGDGFDSYYGDKQIFIINGNTIYKVYKTGLRKKIITFSNSIMSSYFIQKKYILNDKIFVINKKDNSFGLLKYNNDYKKITDNQVYKIKKIDNDHFLLKTKKETIIYNIKDYKKEFITKKNIDSIILFNNGYKTIKVKKLYLLLDKNNKEITSSDKQIIINKKIMAGRLNDEVYLYHIKTNKKELLNKIRVYDKIYFYDDNNIYNQDFNYLKNNKYITSNKEILITTNNKKLLFENIKYKKVYEYNLKQDEYIVNNTSLKDVIIIENSEYIKIIDYKGNLIKKIKDKKIINYYNVEKGKVLIITGLEENNKIFQGSYLAE